MTNGRLMTSDAGPALSPPRGRLGRYALWQFRDFALQRGAAMAVIAGALAYPVIVANHAPSRIYSRSSQGIETIEMVARAPIDVATNSLVGVLYPVIVLGALLAVRGLVSDDRQHGYHRFLFSKPVSITRYYAQSYAVTFAGFVAVVGLVTAFFAIFMRPLPMMPGLVASAAVFFALVGGVGFLLSTLVRADWLWLVVTMGVASAVGGFYHAGVLWLAPLVAVLPPVEALSTTMRALVVPDATVRPVDLFWVLSYAIGCVALALFILRRRALPA